MDKIKFGQIRSTTSTPVTTSTKLRRIRKYKHLSRFRFHSQVETNETEMNHLKVIFGEIIDILRGNLARLQRI